MSSFWQSPEGQLTGKPEDAFIRPFQVIPDNTKATAKIVKFYLVDGNDKKHYEIDWELTAGDFKGQHVFQKIKAFDNDSKKRHKALNMLMYIFKLFEIKPSGNDAPGDQELMQFTGKYAGLKIQEWSMPKNDGSGMMEGNYISEVWPATNFQCETGVKQEVVHTPQSNGLDSAFSRNQPVPGGSLDDDLDLPF